MTVYDHHRRAQNRRDRDTVHQAAQAVRKSWSKAHTTAPLPYWVLRVAPVLDEGSGPWPGMIGSPGSRGRTWSNLPSRSSPS